MKRLDTSLFREMDLFKSLTEAEIQAIINAHENGTSDYASKQVIFKESHPGVYMYVVLDGLVELFVKGEIGANRDACVGKINEGGYFGENVVMTQKPANYTATAITAVPSTLFKIHKKNVVSIIGNLGEAFPADKVRDMLLKIPIFKGLNREEIRTVREWAPLVNFKEGSNIYEPGSQVENLYVVHQGRIEQSNLDDNGKRVITASQGPGEYFGEEALLPGGEDKHKNFARAATDSILICIPKDIFKSLLERDPNIVNSIKMVQNLRILKMKNPK
jgi:CRP-like cAMP-binding protein